MVVSGVPERNGIRHVAEIANLALELLSIQTNFEIKHLPQQRLQLRIGMHSGKLEIILQTSFPVMHKVENVDI